MDVFWRKNRVFRVKFTFLDWIRVLWSKIKGKLQDVALFQAIEVESIRWKHPLLSFQTETLQKVLKRGLKFYFQENLQKTRSQKTIWGQNIHKIQLFISDQNTSKSYVRRLKIPFYKKSSQIQRAVSQNPFEAKTLQKRAQSGPEIPFWGKATKKS